MITWDGWLKLGAMATAIGVLGGLWLTSHSLAVASRQSDVAVRTEITTRYSKAIEQIGNTNSLDVRLGGIYSLARVAHDSPDDQPTVVSVLSAFVRTHAPNNPETCTEDLSRTMPTDIQAALTVLGTRRHDDLRVDLRHACLRNADLHGAFLRTADISHSDLSDAVLAGADMRQTSAQGTNFTGAFFLQADLEDAYFADCHLEHARFDIVGSSIGGGSARNLDKAAIHCGPYDSVTWPPGFVPPSR